MKRAIEESFKWVGTPPTREYTNSVWCIPASSTCCVNCGASVDGDELFCDGCLEAGRNEKSTPVPQPKRCVTCKNCLAMADPCNACIRDAE